MTRNSPLISSATAATTNAATAATATTGSPPDWSAIAADYIAGHSLRALCTRYGIPRTTLWRRVHQEGWQRATVGGVAGEGEGAHTAPADAGVGASASTPLAASAATPPTPTDTPPAPARGKTARNRGQDIPPATQAMAARHQADIARSRALFQQLLGELETETAHLPLFEQLGLILKEEGAGERAQEVYRKAISMAARVDVAKRLMELLEKLVKLEREAYGLDAKSPAHPAHPGEGARLEDFLTRLAQAPSPPSPAPYSSPAD